MGLALRCDGFTLQSDQHCRVIWPGKAERRKLSGVHIAYALGRSHGAGRIEVALLRHSAAIREAASAGAGLGHRQNSVSMPPYTDSLSGLSIGLYT
jgi:hypothetical protein